MSDDLVKRWDEYVESMGSVMGEVEYMAQQMRDRIEELEAKLAEVEAELEKFHLLWKDACVRSGKNSLRADAAEAALPAVYRLALEDAAERLLAAVTREYKDHRDYRNAIRALPTPTAAELMARIQTGENK